MNKNPICPYCKSTECVIEQPFWRNDSKHNWIKLGWQLDCLGFCISCGKKFEVIADVAFHNSKKVNQSY